MRLRDVTCDDPILEQMRSRLASIYDSRPCFMRDESLCTEDDRRTCILNRAPDCPRVVHRMSEAERNRIMRERIEREESEAERCRIPARLYALLGIGSHTVERVMDSDVVVRMRQHRRGVLVLMGPTGTGKTVAAAYWAWRHRAVFWRAEELATGVNWFDRREVDAISDSPMLVLDDLGAEYGDQKGNWRSKLDALINRRYDAKAPTVITTNLTTEDLRRLVGERVWRRIREDGEVFNCVSVWNASVPPPPEPLPGEDTEPEEE